MAKHGFRDHNSGQVIIVSALIIAVLLLSTAVYVMEVTKDAPTVKTAKNTDFSAYKQAVRNAQISALANASGGGSTQILGTDLQVLEMALQTNSYQAMLTMDYGLLNSSGYQNGLRLSWGNGGFGVSSAYATFTFASDSTVATSEMTYDANVTSAVSVVGSYLQVNDTIKQVNLNLNVQNDGEPALTQSISVSYQNGSEWVIADPLETTNFGDGTYTVSFYAQTAQLNEPLPVSLVLLDQRGITVGANLTCTAT